MPACGDREAVNIAGFVKQLADLCDIVAVAAAVHEVAAADAQGDGIVGADCRAHAFKSLNHETAAVFERAAILVGTVVGQRREELTVQVAGVGFDLDAVKAGLLCDDCGLCLPINKFLDLLDGKLLGHFKVGESAGDGRRCNSLLALNACAICTSAAMHELCENLAASFMDCIGELLKRRDIFLVSEHCAVVGIVAKLIPLHVGEDDKSYAALCAALIKFNNVIHNEAINSVAYAHR